MTTSHPPPGDAAHPRQWRRRFTVPAIVALVGMAGLLAFALWYAPRAREHAMARLRDELSLRVDDLRDVLDTTLAEDRADLETVASFPSTLAVVGSGPPGDGEGIGGPRHLARIFESFARRQAFERIAIVGGDGEVRAATGSGIVPGACREPATETVRSGRPAVAPHEHDTQRLYVAVAVPILGERGEVRGAVVGEYPAQPRLCRGLLGGTPESGTAMMATLAAPHGGRVLFICDPHGPGDLEHERIVEADPASPPKPAPGAPASALPADGFRRRRDHHGRVMYAIGRPLTAEPWEVAVQMPADRVDASIRDDLSRTAAMWTASFLAVAAMVLASWRERERAHQLSRARERARLSLLIDHAADPMIVVDEQGRVREFNRRAPEFYGIEPADLLGRRLGDAHRPDRRLRPRPGEPGQAADADAVLYETTHRAAGGRDVPVQVSSKKVVLDGETLYVAVIRDMTDQRRLQAQFLQAQKMEGIGRLAGGVAHDFNNLLTAILGYADLLASEIRDPEQRTYLEEITKAGSRATALTTQLLAFARRQVVEPRLVDVNALVHDAQKMLQRLVGEDVTVDTALEPGAGAVRADPGQLQQVLVNLVVNARDAMPDGGTVRIETRRVAGVARAEAAKDDGAKGQAASAGASIDYVELAVADTGEGMTPEVRAHIFEPFFTTKPQGKGTGLGLATCHGIVSQGGGHIDLESAPGAGTTVRVRLPRMAHEAESDADDRGALLRGGDETILVVEDEAAVRRLAALSLTGHGYRVLDAPDGQTALELAATAPDIDLLVTDVVMPGIDGRELAARLRVTRPGLPVLFVSGHTEDAILKKGVLDADLEFLHKPFAPADLARRVREMLDGTADAQSRVAGPA
jgi:PAS domain S-box-containing protein